MNESADFLDDVSEEILDLQGAVVDTQISNLERRVNTRPYSTHEILKWTDTEQRLLKIVEGAEFQKYGETAPERLNAIFESIRLSIGKYLISRFAIDTNTEDIPPTITQVLIPAIERQLMDFLRQNQHQNNVADLTMANAISFENFGKLFSSVGSFAGKAMGMYTEGKKLINAIDFLSIHKDRLRDANRSEILRNPLKMQDFLSNPIWLTDRDPYGISLKEVGIEFGDTGEFGLNETEQQEVRELIGNIEVVESPTTTQLILGLVEKSAPFFDATAQLSHQAMDLLDGVDGPLGMVKSILWVDVLKSVNESEFLKGVLNFVLKIIGFTGGFDGLVKRRKHRRIDRQLDQEKRNQISDIFSRYVSDTERGISAGTEIPEANKLSTIFKSRLSSQVFANVQPYFNIDRTILFSAMDREISDPANLNPAMIKVAMGDSRFNYYTKQSDGVVSIDVAKFEKDREKILQAYINNMTTHLASKEEFLKSIDVSSTDKWTNTIAFTMISGLFVQPDHVIDGVEAKVFLPESFMSDDYSVVMPPITPPENSTADVNTSVTTPEATTTASQTPAPLLMNRWNMESLRGYDGNLMLLDKVPGTTQERAAFKAKVEEISADLKINPNWLMAIINMETNRTFDHKIQNSIGATGLIQFMPRTAEGLWTTTNKLKEMTAVEQLDYVKKFYQGVNYNSMRDMYLKTFFPIALNHSNNDEWVFQSSRLTAATIARQNPAISRGKPEIKMKNFNEYIQDITRKDVPQAFHNQFA